MKPTPRSLNVSWKRKLLFELFVYMSYLSSTVVKMKLKLQKHLYVRTKFQQRRK